MNRQEFPFPWAVDGEIADPDLDKENPSFVEDRYQGMGWEAEKPPSEWQNFLSNFTDLKIIEWLTNGLFVFRDNVTYSPNAIVSKDGILYKNISGKSSVGAFNTKVWQRYLASKQDEYASLIKALSTLSTNHYNATNPHKDTVDTIIGGTELKTTVDKAFGDPNDPKTIVHHMAQKGAVHKETAEQLGTLDITRGGNFTGPVNLNGGISKGGGRIAYDPQLDALVVSFGGSAIAIRSNGEAVHINSAGRWLLLTEGNYDKIEIESNKLFVLPNPVCSMNIATSINDVMAFGEWTISSNKDPAFTSDGFDVASAVLTLIDFKTTQNSTLYVFGKLGGKTVGKLVDIPARGFGTLNSVLELVGAFTHVQTVAIYPALSVYQKTMLAVK